ncbi:MAG TPA: mechanosensitive ion channel domain-containing protein, partial [Methylocystis sp.]
VQAGLSVAILTRGLGALACAALIVATLRSFPRGRAGEANAGRDWLSLTRLLGFAAAAAVVVACALGYVTFANFFIVQGCWTLVVSGVLLIVLTLSRAATDRVLAPTGRFGLVASSMLGVERQSLRPLAALLSGALTLTCFGIAALLILAPFGVESGDFLSDLQSSFLAVKIADVTISPSTAFVALVLFAITLAAAHALRRWLDGTLLPLTRLDMGLRNSIGASVGYAGFILAVTVAMEHLGLGFEKLAIVAGALSVGIGFGLQSIVNNFVSGLILLWERAIRVGDWVVLGDEQGYVKRINVRSTEIETFDRATMIVPNSNLVTGVVKNWLRGDKVGRVKILLAPHSGVDPEQIRDILLAAARAQDGVLRIPAPQVMFLGMEAAQFRFELWCYLEDVEQSSRVRSDLHFDLHKRLADAGIAIAAPPTPTSPTVVQFEGFEKFAVEQRLLEADDDAKQGLKLARKIGV